MNIIKNLIEKILKRTKRLVVKQGDQSLPWREVFPNYNSGVALKGARYKEALTQQELADRLGVSRSTVSRMENCKKKIDVVMAHKLSRLLHIGYKVFLEREED